MYVYPIKDSKTKKGQYMYVPYYE